METIIASILIVMIMLGFAVFIFQNVIKRINQSAKKWFIDKLQEYNYLVDEKEEQLENLRKQIEEAQRKLKVAEKIQAEPENIFSDEIEQKLDQMRKFKNLPSQIPRRPEVVYDIPTPQYKEASFFNNYKQLKKIFDLDIEQILKNFVKEHKQNDDEEQYKILAEFRKKFSDKIIYECSTLEKEEQYELIEAVLTKEEKEYINLEEKSKNQFTVRELLEKIENKMKKIDPTIYVYVAKGSKKYDEIDERIRTHFYKNMSEGVIIHYKGKMYDYSI